MLTHPTLDRLNELGLHGMAKAFQDLGSQPEARALEHGEWLAILLEHEATMRQQKRFEARARAARLHEARAGCSSRKRGDGPAWPASAARCSSSSPPATGSKSVVGFC